MTKQFFMANKFLSSFLSLFFIFTTSTYLLWFFSFPLKVAKWIAVFSRVLVIYWNLCFFSIQIRIFSNKIINKFFRDFRAGECIIGICTWLSVKNLRRAWHVFIKLPICDNLITLFCNIFDTCVIITSLGALLTCLGGGSRRSPGNQESVGSILAEV